MAPETESYLLLSQLSVSELEHLRAVIDKMLDRPESIYNEIDLLGAFRLSQSVKQELSQRQQQYPDDGTM